MKKYLIILVFLVLIMALCFFLGKQKGETDCEKEKVQIVTKVVEVEKEVNRKEQEVLLRPNDNWIKIYERICNGEKDC